MNSTVIDKEINDYLPQLSEKQKQAVLTVVKTFAEEQYETGEYSDEFKAELDNRFEEYMNGGELISEAEVNEEIRQIIQHKTK